MQHIQNALMALETGPSQQFGRLAMVPLLAANDDATSAAAAYLTLGEALAAQLARVAEVSDAGQVRELAFDNLSKDRDVLLLDGEELVGAKQNRILNLTILVAPGTRVVIPVSCVEQGRWRHTSKEFRSSDRALFAEARAAKMRQVNASMSQHGQRHSDQSDVWRRVSEKAERLNAHSATHAMADIFDSRSAELERYVAAFKVLPRQTGAVFLVDGAAPGKSYVPSLMGLELFDSPSTLALSLPKLIGTFAMEAIVQPSFAAEVSPTKAPRQAAQAAHLAAELVADVARCEPERFKAIGEGEDLRITRPDLVGGGLVARGRLVHLAAYRQAIGEGGRRGAVH